MANRKTNRKEHSQTALPERPGQNSALVVAASSAVRPSRSGQELSRCGRSQEHRCILPAHNTERPRTTESVFGRGSNGGVVALRKSDPMNGCATLYHHNEGKWLCRHFEAVATPIFVGATAITRVEHRRRSRLCISRPQYEMFTLPKQCRTTTHTQKLTSSMSHQLCLLGKFSDVAGANRLEADLPEVNLPLWNFAETREMSGQLGWPTGTCP